MATMTTNDGITVNVTMEELAQLFKLAGATIGTREPEDDPKEAKPRAPKAEAKSEEIRARHDAVLDTRRVDRMTRTAIDGASKQGFECKSSKQGKWVWIYPCGKDSGKGRTPEFKSLRLANGWKHSMKRGAYYRDFS